VGAAGGKQQPQAVEVADLASVTHDPLLASLRQRLRQHHGAVRNGPLGVACVFSREAVQAPPESCDAQGNLNCHGYGSSVSVTATFGMVAAAHAMRLLCERDVKTTSTQG
jgi:tRNA A37 threonylcarbamoyladenosine dehydratase